LLEALNPENPLERIVYRKQVASASQSRQEFVKIKNNKAQYEHEKTKVDQPNEQIGFKTLKYSVAESAKTVKISIQKHTSEAMSFQIKTSDGSAKAPGDYITFDEPVKMEAGE